MVKREACEHNIVTAIFNFLLKRSLSSAC